MKPCRCACAWPAPWLCCRTFTPASAAVYARQANDSDLIKYATEIRVRAQRRAGEMLAQTEKAPAGRPAVNRSNDTTNSPATLSDMGITKDQSSNLRLHPSGFEMPKLRSPRRGAFSVSDRVALAEAVAERMGKRKGERTDLGTSGNISLSDKGRTTDLAAAKAGLGSGKTLEAAQ